MTCDTRRRTRIARFGLLGIALAIGVLPALADITGDTVSLYVTVQKDRKAVPGLTARNFRIYEQGEPCTVRSAAPSEPASIVLLVENSLTSWRFLNDVRSAMRGFLKAAPEGHSYALVSYARRPTVEATLTKEIDRIRMAYVDLQQSAWRETDTYDAVYRVIEEMDKLPGRRVLIFIGFGYDAFSRYTVGELQRKVETTNTLIYGIATGSDLRQERPPYGQTAEPLDLRKGKMLVEMLARRSGGKFYCPSCEADYADSMRDVMETLDRQYTVVYERPVARKAGFRKLKVEAFEIIDDIRRDFKVRVRDGWWLEPPTE
jgi:VWFA-related protein